MTSTDFILYAGGTAILILTAFISYLLYAMTKTVQSTNKTIDDINDKLKKINPAIEETTKTLTELNQSAQTINENVLKPIASITSMFKGFKQILSSVKEGTSIFSKESKEK